ncbi:MAG: serine--tRNA ligase [Parcubacteria group bacterium CG1_02_37_51]|uniref:Serine--tRNA ligase n=2 Tax=Candidatus Komeiliibacteriota TaxID=1817908 RepID=A0A2M8DQQ1_9BACT|nr:MAG: serine--tRNA ligase [Parcubacteria group bacterium CG1_02_37_51]PIY94541.1 MAG: serine--tRNA ligase [Candidatus Komeilibacteria bacterium CG_4_10_14_0_8_um_filter_37_78]PJC01470.1 MAG: serine--tRNA ligase [Candidatus Komeilibacteria bacterium CG_4_9_14_0_8_um_filter_36_9]
MLDINKIREDKDKIEAALLKRIAKDKFNLNKIIKLDDERKALINSMDTLKAERNKNSKVKPNAETITEMKRIGNNIKKIEEDLDKVSSELNELLGALPNIVADDVVAGGKENNKVIDTFGKIPEFDFEPKDHMQLAKDLDIIDYERAAKMSGTGFWIYKGLGAELEWALLNYFIAYHRQNKYTFIWPPYLLTEQSAFISGHLPKFRDDLFWTEDHLCLNATSEMMLGNYHRDELMDQDELPLKYYAYSTCFRREAGSYGAGERGMIRGHQFNKIEMFQFTHPDRSWQAMAELTNHAKNLVQGLGLHFNTVQLAAEDCSAAMAKTIDLEVYLPSMKGYKEVSSISNALDYQARRGNIRYKDAKTGKNEYLHTLNASGLATSRLVPAILEQFQQKDGSVKIPKALKKYCGFKVIK